MRRHNPTVFKEEIFPFSNQTVIATTDICNVLTVNITSYDRHMGQLLAQTVWGGEAELLHPMSFKSLLI